VSERRQSRNGLTWFSIACCFTCLLHTTHYHVHSQSRASQEEAARHKLWHHAFLERRLSSLTTRLDSTKAVHHAAAEQHLLQLQTAEQQLAAAVEALQGERAAHARLQAEAVVKRAQAAAERVSCWIVLGRGCMGVKQQAPDLIASDLIAKGAHASIGPLINPPPNRLRHQAELERLRAECRALTDRADGLETERSRLRDAAAEAEAAASQAAHEATAMRKKCGRLQREVVMLR